MARRAVRATDNERKKDERDLAWLAMRREGLTAGAIADRFGTNEVTVKNRTLDVRRADLAEAGYWGDDPKAAAREYWDSAAMRASGQKQAQRGIRKDGLKSKGARA